MAVIRGASTTERYEPTEEERLDPLFAGAEPQAQYFEGARPSDSDTQGDNA